MAYKRFFKKDQKRKLQTGGAASIDPPDNWRNLSYSEIYDLYQQGELGFDQVESVDRGLALSAKHNAGLGPDERFADFFDFGKRRRQSIQNLPKDQREQYKRKYGNNTPNSNRATPTSGEGLNPLWSEGFGVGQQSVPEFGFGPSDLLTSGSMLPQRPLNEPAGRGQSEPNEFADSDNPVSEATVGDRGVQSPEGNLEKASGSQGAMYGQSSRDVALDGVGEGLLDEEGGGGGDLANTLLQFAPDMMNVATGLFGEDKTEEPTQIDQRAVGMMPDSVNVSPQLNEARSAYRAILADPNASTTQKLAAQAQLNNQTSRIMADKQNREAQMQANKADIQASLDRSQSQYDAQARQDRMAADAQLGPTGNLVRQGLTGISQKALQSQAEKNKAQQANQQLAAILSSQPKAVRERILNALEENNG